MEQRDRVPLEIALNQIGKEVLYIAILDGVSVTAAVL
jgi:hypothetical protein